jgi:hypothetical protein
MFTFSKSLLNSLIIKVVMHLFDAEAEALTSFLGKKKENYPDPCKEIIMDAR